MTPLFNNPEVLSSASITVIKKLVKKIITNLDSSNVCSPNCIPAVILKNCEPEPSYKPAELFNVCLREFCLADYFSSAVRVFTNVGERSMRSLSKVSKICEKSVDNNLVDQLKKYGLFSNFQ